MLLPRPLLRPPTSSLLTISSPKPRTITTSPPSRASVLFALHALSNSRETQHLNKLSNLNRIEHSPSLKLIKTSEIDPYPLPTPPPRPAFPSRQTQIGGRDALSVSSRASLAARIWDDRALRVGRVILADHGRQTHRLHRSLKQAHRRSSLAQHQANLAREAHQRETRHHKREMRSAGLLILASVGVATGLATWRFWPTEAQTLDSGELGRRIAARAQQGVEVLGAGGSGAASASASSQSGTGERNVVAAPAGAPAVEPGLAVVPASAAAVVVPEANTTSTGGWWKGLFWARQ